MTRYRHAVHLAAPTPAHALTPAAESARRAVRDYAVARNARRLAPELPLVTSTPQPWERVALDALTGAPATFAKAALAGGLEVAARRAGRAIQVAVRSPRIRITWVDGKLSGIPVALGAGVLVDGRKTTLATAKAALS